MQKEKTDKIVTDENQKMKFDFTNAITVFEPHDLANMYSNYLSDVDFVIEDKERLLCIEYKNANVEGASNPEAFTEKIRTDKFWDKIAKKFYGTMFLVWACDQNPSDKPVQYILLMETNPGMDPVLKKRLAAKMKKRLPFRYKENNEVKRHVIDNEFLILDIEEWNKEFAEYPICSNIK